MSKLRLIVLLRVMSEDLVCGFEDVSFLRESHPRLDFD